MKFPALLAALSLISSAFPVQAAEPAPDQDGWMELFNGKDLDGWTPKITGYAYGENFGDTFRVEDGVIRVSYDKYDEFRGRFGHLFYRTPFTDYILRVEYRMVGEQLKGGPGWAVRNSGVMIHGQDPATMSKDQLFPVSLEVQLLGGDGSGERTTANLCTPGTIATINGEVRREHCVSSSSKTFHGDQWVTVEIEARGPKIIHRVNGETVLEYENPVLDSGDPDAQKLIKNGDPALRGGTISLQSESHPVEFRSVRIKPLVP